MHRSKYWFLAGVFFICMSVLMLQIMQTRVLSVILHYHLAFFAISMAMLGMTIGSLYVYFHNDSFTATNFHFRLAGGSLGFALSVLASTLLLITSAVFAIESQILMTTLVLAKLIVILATPYVFAGIAVSLALTRSPYPVGLVYGTDLVGAAGGCLGTLLVLNLVDGVSAILVVAAVGALAGCCFKLAAPGGNASGRRKSGLGLTYGLLPAALVLFAVGNAAVHPNGLTLTVVKEKIERHDTIAKIEWNSFSRVRAGVSETGTPYLWSPSDIMPAFSVDQRTMDIDGDAGTVMYRFDGDSRALGFLKYDITNLAYSIRHGGRAAIIGVGGGRDILAAHAFGFGRVVGIELNPILVRWLTRDFHDYNTLSDLPTVDLIVDDARSWFARSRESFDLIQMSMIDTWAATGAGAFSLSENGLYTIQGWVRFLNRLNATGVFTVSRWYAKDKIDETGRLLSIAQATLLSMGVDDPAQHIFMATSDHLATLVLGRSKLTEGELATLRGEASRLGFRVAVSPDLTPESSAISQILSARRLEDLSEISSDSRLRLSPPTDETPFFFNMLKMSDPASMVRAIQSGQGVVRGNLLATLTLGIIVTLSALFVLLLIIVPALPALRQTSLRLGALGSAYFALIGLGFMLVEIALLQRLGIVLGHPVYGLAIGLFGIILFTGIGSLVSERLPLHTRAQILLGASLLATYIALFPFWFSGLAGVVESKDLLVRALACLAALAPATLCMGFAFPTGLRLVNAIDRRPTPWFWAVNGAAGVLGAGLAVAISIEFSISITFLVGAACYLVLAPIATRLAGLSASS